MSQENKTPKEIYTKYIVVDFYNKVCQPINQELLLTDVLITAMEEYGKQEFDRAIELAAENAEKNVMIIPAIGTSRTVRVTGVIDKEGILNLKIK